jgi:APA family basic amino acid/polyamine antiporter
LRSVTPASDSDAVSTTPPSRLSRRLGTFDAVVIGLGSMVGAGIFAVLAPAAAAAGSGLLVGLAGAAVVAYCNAMSSARLAARFPASGGTYVYGRERLGFGWGFLAGWGFVIGKIASCSAMALTFGSYLGDGATTRVLAIAGVVALTAVNLRGIAKTAMLTRAIVAVVLLVLVTVVIACLLATDQAAGGLDNFTDAGWRGMFEAGGLCFFAFAGYARIATLGEEVKDPARTIPRAIPIALGIALALYAAVAASALLAVGPDVLAGSDAPLVTAVRGGPWSALAPVVRIGACVASLGVLLSLLAGVSRTAFAMAANRDFPRWLAAVHPRSRIPHRAEVVVGGVVAAVVVVADLRDVIGFSAFTVLVYYAIANASAWTLPEPGITRARAALGLFGCLVLAFSLPAGAVVSGTALLVVGAVGHAVRPSGPPAASDRSGPSV